MRLCNPLTRLIFTATLLLSFSSHCGSVRAAKNKPPNVIIVLADDLGMADVSYAARRLNGGVAAIETPHLDALAYHSNTVQMTNAFTHLVCGPSRAALVTGRLAHKLGNPFASVEGGSLDPKYKTVGHEFQRRGYSTHFVGKWGIDFPKPSKEALDRKKRTYEIFNGVEPGMGPTQRGFDTFYGLIGSAHNHFTKEVVYSGMVDWHRHNQTHRLDYPNLDHEPEEYSTHLFTREAEDIIKGWSTAEEPGFMHLSYTAPHDPLQAPDEYLQRPSCKKMKNWRRQTYCGMVTALDDGIGRIYKTLQEQGLADNTIIAFTTDNGGAPAVGGFNYPYRGQKGTIYEGGFKTPAILHVPNAVVQNSLYDNTIHLVDFAPTLLGLVDRSSGELERLGKYEDLGEGMDGKDHSKWMMESVAGRSLKEKEEDAPKKPGPPRQTTVLEYNAFIDHSAYLEGDWKLLLGNAGRPNLFVEPRGKYYDDNGRPRFVAEELVSDIFDRGLGENWFLYGWVMRFGMDAALATVGGQGKGERPKNRTMFQLDIARSKPWNFTVELTEERLPKVDFSNFNPVKVQLYNLKDDPYETANVALDNQELVESMVARLREEVEDGPGHCMAVQKHLITKIMPELAKLVGSFLVCVAVAFSTISFVAWNKASSGKARNVKTPK